MSVMKGFICAALLGLLVAAGGCSDEGGEADSGGGGGTDSGQADLSVNPDSGDSDGGGSDVGLADAALPDGAMMDGAMMDTATKDTATKDTSMADTSMADTAMTDTAMADSSAPGDTGTSDGASPTPMVVISEFLPDPSAVTDANGEWFEVFNPGTSPVDLKGWTIKDDGSDSHKITASVVVPGGGYAVLGVNKNPATNGGTPVNYEYSSFHLANGNDEIELRDAKNVMIDRVAYDTSSGWTVSAGASNQVIDPFAANNVPSNWCQGSVAWSGGDKGSPGAPSMCAPVVLDGGVVPGD